jgi:hypothetical protein
MTKRDLKDAPKTVKRLADVVHSVDAVLKLLQGVEDRKWELHGISVVEQSRTMIGSYTQACDHFRADCYVSH